MLSIVKKYYSVIFDSSQGLVCCFPNRRESFSMGRFKESEIICINISGIPKHWSKIDYMYISNNIIFIFEKLWTESPFRANLLFVYAQSGPERTSFSGPTVSLCITYFFTIDISSNIFCYHVLCVCLKNDSLRALAVQNLANWILSSQKPAFAIQKNSD